MKKINRLLVLIEYVSNIGWLDGWRGIYYTYIKGLIVKVGESHKLADSEEKFANVRNKRTKRNVLWTF